MANEYDWTIIPNAESIKTIIPGTEYVYDLFNLTQSEALMYQERDWGINLGFGDPAKSSNVRIRRASGSNDPLKFGEMFAINIRRGKWLYYTHRDYGVNLGWSDTPKYEWRLDSPEEDQAAKGIIPTLTQVGLYNSVENDHLMYEVRDWGVNLKWFKDAGKYSRWQDIGSLLQSGKDLFDAIA